MSIQSLRPAADEEGSDWLRSGPEERAVRVRVNAAGARSVGVVRLPHGCDRLSDHLNGPGDFFTLFEELDTLRVDPDNYRVIAKRAVSYVEAVEEPQVRRRRRPAGSFQAITVRLVNPLVTLNAELFVPQHRCLERVLNDRHPFVNLRNVTFLTSREHYRYLAVGKAQMISAMRRSTPQSAAATKIA